MVFRNHVISSKFGGPYLFDVLSVVQNGEVELDATRKMNEAVFVTDRQRRNTFLSKDWLVQEGTELIKFGAPYSRVPDLSLPITKRRLVFVPLTRVRFATG
jgi:hypothetical protein